MRHQNGWRCRSDISADGHSPATRRCRFQAAPASSVKRNLSEAIKFIIRSKICTQFLILLFIPFFNLSDLPHGLFFVVHKTHRPERISKCRGTSRCWPAYHSAASSLLHVSGSSQEMNVWMDILPTSQFLQF